MLFSRLFKGLFRMLFRCLFRRLFRNIQGAIQVIQQAVQEAIQGDIQRTPPGGHVEDDVEDENRGPQPCKTTCHGATKKGWAFTPRPPPLSMRFRGLFLRHS